MKRKTQKRKTIKKQIKSKLYVAKATDYKSSPRPEVVAKLELVLKEPKLKKVLKHVNRISITKSTSSAKRVTTGRWIPAKKTLKVIDHSCFTAEYYECTVVHELSHVDWHTNAKWNKEAFIKFNAIVNKIHPINDYLSRNEDKWRRWERYDFDENATQYANEMHSALAELHYTPKEFYKDKATFDMITLKKAYDAYCEFHNVEPRFVTKDECE